MKKSTVFSSIIFSGVALTACQVGSSSSGSNAPNNVANSVPTAVAYITDKENLSKCLLNQQGQFIACFHAESGLGLQKPTGVGIDGTNLYIASYSKSSVRSCKLKGSSIQSCSSAFQDDVSVDGPSNIAFFESYAYISDSSGNDILRCNLTDHGLFANCSQTGNSISWVSGVSIRNNFAYISNWNIGTILKCQINDASGELMNCNPTGGVGNFVGPQQVAFYESYAYIPNVDGDSISMCQVSESDGSLANCKYTGAMIKDLQNITINNSLAYITSGTGISICQIDTLNGNLLSACQFFASEQYGWDKPGQIVIKPLNYFNN